MTTTLGTRDEVGVDGGARPIVALRDVFCVHRTSEGDAAALQGTTLDVDRGELLCVLGPSGAGKSTLLRVIAGLQTPSAGVVSVLGYDIGRLRGRVRARLRHESIGFLGQQAEAAVAPDLRVRDVVALPLALRGQDGAAQRHRVAELLESAGLGDRAGARPGELSGGERQRVAVCAALAHRPSLLLADEPTGELDAVSAQAVLVLIAELTRAHGTTAIVVSHDPATSEFADRSVRLRDGRIVEDRRGRDGGLVIGRGGWLQLPAELLARARIGDRARVTPGPDGGLLLTPAGDDAPRDGAGGAAGDRAAADRSASVSPPAAPLLRSSMPSDGAGWEPADVRVRELTRSRGRGAARRRVIAGIDRRFAAGRVTAITGRSGSGKTTLLRMLAGIDVPDSGELLLDSRELHALDAEQRAAIRRACVGYLPQEPSPVAFLSAEENVVLALRIRGWSVVAASDRAAAVLSWVGLAERARQRVARLSAGEAQRVALARALASARGLLILDEPTSRLDQAGSTTIAQLLAAAAAHDHQTVIFASHDPQVIAHADEVLSLGG